MRCGGQAGKEEEQGMDGGLKRKGRPFGHLKRLESGMGVLCSHHSELGIFSLSRMKMEGLEHEHAF